MKILVALHSCMDLGGIIDHTEQLIAGLKALGHTVNFNEVLWVPNAVNQKKDGVFTVGASGVPYAQGKGWSFPANRRLVYKGAANLHNARQYLAQYDLIIWTVPVPPKNRNNVGNNDWPLLYDLPKTTKQIAFIHDGNARLGSNHILAVQHHLDAIACVHACALGGASYIERPRSLILNPQENPVREVPAWEDKSRGFVNMQTFKGWKHAHELIGAIRYMRPKGDDELREVAGKGIEYQYLTSVDKCKDAYFHEDGERFWEAAIENGMTHHDYWDKAEVDMMLNEARILVDPSWSNKYSAVGGHWNRVVVDCMIRGGVPVARSKGMGDELFKAGIHYVEIPEGVDLQQYAEIVQDAGEMSDLEAKYYREANLDLLPLFDRNAVAARLLGLLDGSTETIMGEHDPEVHSKAEDILLQQYGVLL